MDPATRLDAGPDDPALSRAVALARAWRASLPERPVGVPITPAEIVARLPAALPETGEDAAAVLDDLAAAVEPGLVATGGPRYFGFVIGGALPVALAADWLTAAWDQNAAAAVMSPAVAAVESVTGDWVLDLLGLPASAAVGFVTGAQTATLSCLAAARHALLAGVGWDVEADGLAGAPPLTVLIGEQAHATVVQALRLLGLGARRAVRIAVDEQGRMRPDDLRVRLAHLDGPVLVCAQAGQVNTGAFDPLDAITDRTGARAGTWLHVDGAFGLWAAASPDHRHLTAGAERADSWAVDAHKWLNVPYDSAMAIVRDRDALTAALSTSAAYLPLGGHDPSSRTLEASRRGRAVPVHAALRGLGRRGVADLVARCCALARQAADELGAHPRVEVLNDVVLNQVVLGLRDADEAEVAARIRAVQEEGTCWVGGTTWAGRPAIRFSVSNHTTTAADVRRATAAILAALDAGDREV